MVELNYKPVVLVDIKSLSEDDWLTYRGLGIGGSDAAAALGCSPYKAARELFYDKKGMESNSNDGWVAMEIGNRLESLVASLFVAHTGYDIIKDTNMYLHPLYPFMLASLDYRYSTESGEKGILEIKTAGVYSKDQWENNQVPFHYELQVRHYLAVMNLNHAWIACLFGNNAEDFVIRRIERDYDIEEDLIAKENYFWHEYFMKDIEPPLIEKPKIAMKCIDKYFTSNPAHGVLKIDGSNIDNLNMLMMLKQEKAKYEKEARTVDEKIKSIQASILALMSGHDEAVCEDNGKKYVIQYKESRSAKISKQSMELLKIEHPEIYSKYAQEVSSRRFKIVAEEISLEKKAAS